MCDWEPAHPKDLTGFPAPAPSLLQRHMLFFFSVSLSCMVKLLLINLNFHLLSVIIHYYYIFSSGCVHSI